MRFWVLLPAVAAIAMLVGIGMREPRSDASAAGPVVLVAPPSTTFAPGATIDVEIAVSSVSGLGAYEFVLAYDPTVVSLEGVSDAGFLASTGRSPVCRNDSKVGEVVYACNTSLLTPSGPSGAGSLSLLRFKALVDGETALHFIKVGLATEDGDGIELGDYQEGVLRVGVSTGSTPAATPTKVPGHVVDTARPTPIPGAPTPFGETLSNPSETAVASSAVSEPTQVGVAGSSGTGSQGGGSSTGGVSGSGAAGSTQDSGGFPVAGSGDGTQHQEVDSPWGTTLWLILFGALLALVGWTIRLRA